MYVFITWLLINLLHPFALSFYFNTDNGLVFDSDFLAYYPLVFIYSLLFSSVSLMLSYVAIYFIKKIISKNSFRFVIWLLSSLVITVINFWLLFLILDEQMNWQDMKISIPAMITVAIVILIRYKYFIDTMDENHRDNLDIP
jgi:cell division protein FtsW (lipid II flippase)